MWTREDTRDWITQLENRIEDIDYYLRRTIKWCEDHYIYENDRVFMCSFVTCIWVSHQRNEPITYVELLEILGLGELAEGEDKIYELGDKFADLDHEEVLAKLTYNFKGF